MVFEKSVLIAGCGYVGTALGRLLVGSEGAVWGLRRRPSGLPEGIRPLRADLSDPKSLRGLPGSIDAVVYAVSPAGFDDDAYRQAYVEWPRNLLDALGAGSRPRRLVMVSSTSVYGDTDGAWVDEESPARPSGFSGRRVLEGERSWLESGDEALVIRFGGIYGPGRTRLLDSVASGSAVRPPQPVYTNRIHRDDCAGALRHLITLAAPERVYLGVDSEPADLGAVLTWIADRLGVSRPPLGVGTERRRRGGNKRCRNARLVGSGYSFTYPTFREGYEALIAAGAAGR